VAQKGFLARTQSPAEFLCRLGLTRILLSQNGFDYLLTYSDNPQTVFPRYCVSWMVSSGEWPLVGRICPSVRNSSGSLLRCEPVPPCLPRHVPVWGRKWTEKLKIRGLEDLGGVFGAWGCSFFLTGRIPGGGGRGPCTGMLFPSHLPQAEGKNQQDG